jgi:hypothetical protein
MSRSAAQFTVVREWVAWRAGVKKKEVLSGDMAVGDGADVSRMSSNLAAESKKYERRARDLSRQVCYLDIPCESGLTPDRGHATLILRGSSARFLTHPWRRRALQALIRKYMPLAVIVVLILICTLIRYYVL